MAPGRHGSLRAAYPEQGTSSTTQSDSSRPLLPGEGASRPFPGDGAVGATAPSPGDLYYMADHDDFYGEPAPHLEAWQARRSFSAVLLLVGVALLCVGYLIFWVVNL